MKRSKFKCQRGHRWTPENTIIQANGARKCRACTNMRHRLRWAENAAGRRDKENLRRTKRKEGRTGLPDGDHRHGTLTGYNDWNCRCAECKACIAAYHRKRLERKKQIEENARLAAIPETRGQAHWSLDAFATGADYISGTEWDDPVLEQVLERVS